jgi:outer membrane protein
MLYDTTIFRRGAWRAVTALLVACGLAPTTALAQLTASPLQPDAPPAPAAATPVLPPPGAAPATAASPSGPTAPSAVAADSGLRTMGLPDALAYARAHHPQLQEAEARVRAARAAVDVPRSQWLPHIGGVVEAFAGTANNSTAAFLSTTYVALPRIGATTANAPVTGQSFVPYPSTVVGVGITQEVLDFGRISTQVAAANASVDADRYHAVNDRLDVELAVREAFYAVLAERAVVQAAEEAFQRARSHQAMAQAWVDRGLRPRIELVRAEADVARYDVGRVRAHAELATAQHLYAATVGVAEPALDAVGDIAQLPQLPSLLEALQQASARDPLLLELAARLRAQQAQSRAIDAQMRPELYLSGAVSGRGGGAPPSAGGNGLPGEGLLPVVPNYDVSLLLNVPIYDGTVAARARASRMQEEVVRAQASVARQRQVARVEQAYLNVQSAQATLPALTRALDAGAGQLRAGRGELPGRAGHERRPGRRAGAAHRRGDRSGAGAVRVGPRPRRVRPDDRGRALSAGTGEAGTARRHLGGYSPSVMHCCWTDSLDVNSPRLTVTEPVHVARPRWAVNAKPLFPASVIWMSV